MRTALPARRLPEVEEVILDQVRLGKALMTAELHDSHGTPFLRVHSVRDLGRDLLLSLRDEPLCGAVARFTPIGRLHALYWTLGWGCLHDVDGAVATFSSEHRFGREASTPVARLADQWWVADVDGLFERASLLVCGEVRASVVIAAATRC